jgi:hypothetical protein
MNGVCRPDCGVERSGCHGREKAWETMLSVRLGWPRS